MTSRRPLISPTTDSTVKPTIDDDCETIVMRDTLLGFTLPMFSDWIIGIIYFSAMMFGFIANGMVEEGFKFQFPNFSFGWFMTAAELLFFTSFTIIERLISHYVSCRSHSKTNHNSDQNNDETTIELNEITEESEKLDIDIEDPKQSILSVIFHRQIHWKYHMLVAGAMLFSRALTNISLLLLNYPTQVVFKTMKLISVMIGNRYWLGKIINTYELFAAPSLVLSAILFTIGDSTDEINFHAVGIAVVLVSLLFDGVHANAQEKILDNKKCDTKSELLIYSNMFGCIMATVASFVCLETMPLIQYLYTVDVYYLMLWFFFRVLLLYIGVSAYVGFTKKFGVVKAVMITTIRKIITVIISFCLFPSKIFTKYHSLGVLFFCFALMMQVLSRKK